MSDVILYFGPLEFLALGALLVLVPLVIAAYVVSFLALATGPIRSSLLQVSPRVEERLRKSLVIMEVSRQESIEVPESEVQDLVEEKINRLQQALSAEDMRRVLVKDNLQGLVSRTLTEEVIRRTLARLRAIAQGETAMEEKENPESVETK